MGRHPVSSCWTSAQCLRSTRCGSRHQQIPSNPCRRHRHSRVDRRAGKSACSTRIIWVRLIVYVRYAGLLQSGSSQHFHTFATQADIRFSACLAVACWSIVSCRTEWEYRMTTQILNFRARSDSFVCHGTLSRAQAISHHVHMDVAVFPANARYLPIGSQFSA